MDRILYKEMIDRLDEILSDMMWDYLDSYILEKAHEQLKKEYGEDIYKDFEYELDMNSAGPYG